MGSLFTIATPALVLDRAKLMRNLQRMTARMRQLGVELRPHLKTAKSADVAALATAGHKGGITVSTLAEAAYFLDHGFMDLTLAVGISAGKLDAVAHLQQTGATIAIITDNAITAGAIVRHSTETGSRFRVLIEVDSGGNRAGVGPESAALIEISEMLAKAPGIELAGVLTHAGQSYQCRSANEIRAVAEAERAGVVRAAQRLRDAKIACKVVSAGSTPTATFAEDLTGVTEMRPGVFMFGDLDQMRIGTCRREEIAISVLATIIGHYPPRNQFLIDAGALALSKDVSANRPDWPPVGFGLVADVAGRVCEGLRVEAVSQEHGFVTADSPVNFDEWPIGGRVRILPNHACLTATAHGAYAVIAGDATETAPDKSAPQASEVEVIAQWPRVNGWRWDSRH